MQTDSSSATLSTLSSSSSSTDSLSTSSLPSSSSSSNGASDVASAIAGMYNSKSSFSGDRSQSRIFFVRQVNNWIKSVLFKRYVPSGGAYVFDMCCGKGGDLNKWSRAGVGHVVGADIAHKSLEEFVSRYRSRNPPDGRRPGLRFSAELYAGDLGSVRLWQVWPASLRFDAVSCQFAFHYSFESQERARTMMRNAAERLKPGAYFFGTTPDDTVLVRKLRSSGGQRFGNDLYSIDFHSAEPFTCPFGIKYTFALDEAIDPCPEYLVPLDALRQLGEEFGLELVLAQNFHEFFYTSAQKHDFARLLTDMKVLPADRTRAVPDDQWEICYLYRVFVFQKRPSGAVQQLGCPDHVVTPATVAEIVSVSQSSG